MQRKSISFLLVLGAARIGAQTKVTTTGGTANQVPMFSGNATIVNSPIFVLSTKVGLDASAQFILSLGANGTGMNLDAANEISILASGSERFQLNGNLLRIAKGPQFLYCKSIPFK